MIINRFISYLSLVILVLLVFFPEDWLAFHKQHHSQFSFIYTQLSFASSHVYFQFLLLGISPDFRKVAEDNTRIKNHLLWLTLIFISFFIFVYATDLDRMWGWILLIQTWTVWHLTTQTAGIYIATRIAENATPGYFADFKWVKLYFRMVTYFYFFKILEIALPVSEGAVRDQYRSIKSMAFWLLYAVLGGIIVSSYKKGLLKQESAWIFVRMALWPFVLQKSTFMLVVLGAIHGLEYFNVCKNVIRNSLSRDFLPLTLFFFVLMGVELSPFIDYFFPFFSNTPMFTQFIGSFAATSGAVHFLYDGAVFKLRNSKTQAQMLRLIRS